MDTMTEAPLLVTEDFFDHRSETVGVDDLLAEIESDLDAAGKLD